MTTKQYVIAYPNSSIRPVMRSCLVKVDSQTSTDNIISHLCRQFPDLTEDLEHATLYKVSHCLLTG